MLVDGVCGPAAQHNQEGLYQSPFCIEATCLLQLDSLSLYLHALLLMASLLMLRPKSTTCLVQTLQLPLL